MFILDYLCDLSDNVYEIEFNNFKIRDYETSKIIYDVSQAHASPVSKHSDPNLARFIRYNFKSDFLRTKTIGA